MWLSYDNINDWWLFKILDLILFGTCILYVVKVKEAYSSSWNSPRNYGMPLVNGITQCYLPPPRGDRPAFTPTGQVGTRFIDPIRMKGWVGWGVFIATQLNSTDPVEHRTAKSVVFLFMMSRPTNWVNCCSRCRVQLSWVELCRYKHPFTRPETVTHLGITGLT